MARSASSVVFALCLAGSKSVYCGSMDEAAASNAKPFDAETGTPRARITDKNHNHARVLLREFGTGTFTSISDQSYSSRLPQAKASAECSIKNLSAAPGSTF